MDVQQISLLVQFCQSFENSGKADIVQKLWALDNDTGNKHETERYQKKQGPTTLWTFSQWNVVNKLNGPFGLLWYF